MIRTKKHIVSVLSIATLAFTACNNTETSTANTNKETKTDSIPSIQLKKFDNPSPVFETAALDIKDWKVELLGTDSAKVTVNYLVKNYELKSQTPDATTKGCNNSKDGQHIHFILNNGPYTALYEPTHTFTVAVNQPNYVLSFLSRSYHESLKHKGAGQLKYIKVDEKGKIEELALPNTPMVFFSRPKGDYVGAGNIEKVLLDFYLWNTDLASTQNKVKANINGTDFTIDTWEPRFIENAPIGKLNVTLSLVDKDGKNLEGDNTTVNRVANLATQEPIK